MAAQLTGVFEDTLQNNIQNSKVLVVGAGGIGCEILKNLVMCGFNDIEIIDLDTIDVSNLNRQFLFHKEHVGKSKADVARQSALSFNKQANIKAYHDSITTTDYGVSFFKRFNVVLNALDNRQARNHVNRMCLSADVPLIESGTAGYNGQIELIKKGKTQCYECTPKQTQKTYPGCTIRNTPSEPIHCIVWAKHLFNQLFGEDNTDEDVSPDTADPEAAGEADIKALTTDSNSVGNIERVSTRKWTQSNKYDPEKMFNKFFYDDIKYLLSMSNLWKNRAAPQPVKWGEFSEPGSSAVLNEGTNRHQQLWSLAECANVFSRSVDALKESFEKLEDGDHLVWDKDDKYGMDFVAACANIRSYIFEITQKSRFEVKSMAGNIIPAIATTNAITAGVAVMHTFKILQEQYDKCRSVYVRLRPNPQNKCFVPDTVLPAPNPNCYVCSPKPEVVIKIDTTKVTIKYLRNEILIKSLNMVDPDVIIESKGVIVISSEEGETDCNNDKMLKELSIVDGCILKVDDFFQNYELSLIVIHKDTERDEPLFEIITNLEQLKQEQNKTKEMESTENGSTKDEIPQKKPRIEEEDDDDLIVVSNDDMEIATASKSGVGRKRKTTDDEEQSAKRCKIVEEENNGLTMEDDDLILVEDDDLILMEDA